MQVKFDSDMKIFAQIGDPLDHSCTSYIHNAMYALGNVNAINFNVVVKRGELPQFVEAAKVMHLSGFGITMPHKSDIIPLLDECDEFSRIFNSVNHVKIENGRLIGKGLDGLGMRMAIEQAGVELKGRRVLMLGAGSVTGPIAAELCKQNVSAVTILNRTVEKARSIADVLKENFPQVQLSYGPMDSAELVFAAPNSDLVVQCTSLGMDGSAQNYESLGFLSLLPSGAAVADVIFLPRKTRLLEEAERLGYQIINGMGMLCNQQKAMMKFFLDVDLPDSFYDDAEEALMIATAMREARHHRMERGGMV